MRLFIESSLVMMFHGDEADGFCGGVFDLPDHTR